MKVRPPFIYSLIIVLSFLSIQFLIDSYRGGTSEVTVVSLNDNTINYNEDEILELLLSLSTEVDVVVENYSKIERVFSITGESLLVKTFLNKLENEYRGIIKTVSIEKLDSKVIMTCNF